MDIEWKDNKVCIGKPGDLLLTKSNEIHYVRQRGEATKRIWMLIVVFCTIGYVYGQNASKHYVGAHYLFGSCNYHANSFGMSSSIKTEFLSLRR